jgi:hypothetical protein
MIQHGDAEYVVFLSSGVFARETTLRDFLPRHALNYKYISNQEHHFIDDLKYNGKMCFTVHK